MDRKIFKMPLRNVGISRFPCPTCGAGLLGVKIDTFQFDESKDSKAAHDHEAWFPDWIEYVFSCLLVCSNAACKDVVACSGRGTVSEDQFYNEDGHPDIEYTEFFYPEYFRPHLSFFDLPDDTPDDVVKEVELSFSLFFTDPSSAANHIRAALEFLLTSMKVKRYVTNNGKRSFLSLHNRIDHLPTKYNHVKDLFLAIKWLGNAGSHSSHVVNRDDVLDSYELMEELLSEVVTEKRKKAKILAKKINKKKGPK